MKKNFLIGLLVILGFFVLGTDFLVKSGYQVVCGNVRTDFIRSAQEGLTLQQTKDHEDRPTCIMVNSETGEAWVYVHEIKVHTNPSGQTRETVFRGFKRLHRQ
ncbi:MAG: hypothetical protein ACYSSO_02210 [Planctomycetota bacterium]|jgi:hypothetical protein